MNNLMSQIPTGMKSDTNNLILQIPTGIKSDTQLI